MQTKLKIRFRIYFCLAFLTAIAGGFSGSYSKNSFGTLSEFIVGFLFAGLFSLVPVSLFVGHLGVLTQDALEIYALRFLRIRLMKYKDIMQIQYDNLLGGDLRVFDSRPMMWITLPNHYANLNQFVAELIKRTKSANPNVQVLGISEEEIRQL